MKNETTAETLEQIDLKTIAYVISNHREEMDETKLQELADSITSIGVQQPIKICRRGRKNAINVMVFGHRRARASKLAGKETIPAIVVTGWDDKQIAEAQVIENICREDLNPIEEAHCVQTLIDTGSGLDAVASKMNKSTDWCRERLDLLRLHAKVRAMVVTGRLPLKHARLIARVGDKKHQVNLAASATAGQFGDKQKDYLQPLGDLRKQISWILCKLGAARWPKDVEYAGKRPCDGCVDNTNTEPVLFAGITLTSKKGNCTNLACFETKGQAWEKDPVKLDRDAKRDVANKKKGKAGKAAKSDGVDDYYAKQKQIDKLKKDFPATVEQACAVAMWNYGNQLVEHIGAAIGGGQPGLACRPVETVVLAALGRNGRNAEASANLPSIGEVARGQAAGDQALGETWEMNAHLTWQTEPGISNLGEGKVVNVPIGDDAMKYVADLEELIGAWGIADKPGVPDCEAIAMKFDVRGIVKATKPDALEAIAEWMDPKTLHYILDEEKNPKWKIKAIEKRLTQLKADDASGGTIGDPTAFAAAAADESLDVGACVMCCRRPTDGRWYNEEMAICLACVDTIVCGLKRNMAAVTAAIRKAPMWLLEELTEVKLTGDWRRSAVRKQMETLAELPGDGSTSNIQHGISNDQ